MEMFSSRKENKVQKVIKKVGVIRAGSAPDVDTDFHTQGRERVIQYCRDKYGAENVANIITFSTFKAKVSFKSICTIYNVPFDLATRITNTLPDVIDGDEMTLADVYNPDHPRYEEGEDFRRAAESDEIKKYVDMAMPLSGRIRGTGTHPCGVVISKIPLSNVIPTQVRQADEALVTQWTYPQCESLGLIKMDFLGLDTLDIIENTLENIKNNDKDVPDMRELINGPMDDRKTFELLQKGNTVGIFQLGGAGVRDLLIRVHPTDFMDIAATTALYRPGPMKMNAHNQYADRKNGREDIIYICPAFEGTEVEEILKPTYGLIVYQEQCMQLATKFAHMSPYESDQLRKAIGKKKMKLMMQLRPKFIEGITSRGFDEEDANTLWDTIAVFGQYGFNKSHSISYAINAYKICYLKANYPAEFMAALLEQNTSNPDKVALFIQEAVAMGLTVGPVDINSSQVKISSSTASKYSILYGFAGVKQVNTELSEAIVAERHKGGKFKDMADFLRRINKTTKIKSSSLEKLANAGAFDSLNVSRAAVANKAKQLASTASKPQKQTFSLFDMVGGDSNDLISSVDLSEPEYPYTELIRNEADSLGFFVSGHPTTNAGILAKKFSPVSLSDLKTKEQKGAANVLCTFTLLKAKTKRNGTKSIAVRIDDGQETFDCFLPKEIVTRIEKGTELARVLKAKAEGQTVEIGGKSKRKDEIVENFYDDKIIPIYPLEQNRFQRVKFRQTVRGGNVRLMVTDIENINTAYDGSIPYEIRIPANVDASALKAVLDKHRGGTYILAKKDGEEIFMNQQVSITRNFIRELEQVIGAENVLTEGI